MKEISKETQKRGHDERRKSPRASVKVRVTYWVDFQERTDSYAAESFNLSENGIFLKVDIPLALGTDVFLQFRLPGGDQEITVNGEVLWAQKGSSIDKFACGKGIKFKKMDKKIKLLIREYITNSGADNRAKKD